MFHCINVFVINLDEFWIRSLLRFRLYENSMLGSDEQQQDDSSVSVVLASFLQSQCILFSVLLSFRWG